MNAISAALRVLFVAVIASSCSTKLVTDTLRPSDTSTSESVVIDYATAPYCGINTSGMNPRVPRQDEVLVGYKRFYEPGTDPFPCWRWASAAYRGAFKFDLSAYTGKRIVSAVLHLGLGQAEYASGSVAANTGVWVKRIGISTSAWWNEANPDIVSSPGELFPWKPIPGMPDLPHGAAPAVQEEFPVKYNGSNAYQIEVSSVVRSWLDGTEPNLGFILVGTNENTVAESNSAALSPVTNISLDITYAVPK